MKNEIHEAEKKLEKVINKKLQKLYKIGNKFKESLGKDEDESKRIQMNNDMMIIAAQLKNSFTYEHFRGQLDKGIVNLIDELFEQFQKLKAFESEKENADV